MPEPRCVPEAACMQEPSRSESGQATAEYALVLLGAAAISLLLLAWATRTDAIGGLLDAVFDSLRSKI